MDKSFTSARLEDRSYVAFVKRQIHNELLSSAFTKNRLAQINIIISELTSNLIKHAGGGEILWRFQEVATVPCFEVVTVDSGPGIADMHRMMRDGVSTTNTLGQGLGSIQRLSSAFQIYSIPNWGTVSYTVVKPENDKTNRHDDLEVRAMAVPKTLETVSGDGYSVVRNKDHIKIFFADGLGHGIHAYEAVLRGAEIFERISETNPVEIVRQIHSHIRKTRGLVATVAVLDMRSKQWRICGVGNITTRIYGGMMFKHYMSYNGIIGLNIPNSMNETVIPVEKNQQLVMCSDGLRARWDLTKYPSILKFDSMILAAALYKDFNRKTDDASVFIGKVTLEK